MLKYLIVPILIVGAYVGISDSAPSVTHSVIWESGVYHKTLSKWNNALSKSSDINSTTYIEKQLGGLDPVHAANHRDSIIWIPSSTLLTHDFIMLIWFHGHRGYDMQRTFRDRTLDQILPYVKLGKQVVLVLPEMPWTVHGRTPTKRNSLIWVREGDFLRYVEGVKKTLTKHIGGKRLGNIDYSIVGHSAGGSTIKRLGITGDLCTLNPSMVVWSDSSYGRWLDDAWDGCLKDTNIQTKVYVSKNDKPWKNATRFMGQFQDPPKNLELHVKHKPRWTHKNIGNGIVELSGVLD